MDWTRVVVRTAILTAVAAAVVLFFTLSFQRRTPDAPPVPGVASDR